MKRAWYTLSATGLLLLATAGKAAAADSPEAFGGPVWMWPLLLFLFCLVLGVVAVVAGVGGGVLYVPLVRAFFPFHLDFVRGAGLLIALAGSLASAPRLLQRRMTSLHLVLPLALMVSLGAIAGARLGLGIPRWLVEVMLGILVLGLAVMMASTSRRDEQSTHPYGAVAQVFGMQGWYRDAGSGERIDWQAWRARWALPLGFLVGVLGGLFGVGAGWANVPTFNLLMGVPLKVATASSMFLMSLGSASAAWVYFHKGCVIAYIAAPSVLGLMLGSQVGARLLDHAKPKVVRWVVVAVLMLAGVRALIHGIAEMGGGA